MLGESEYIKNYKSPAELHALSPDPPTHAGLSSAQLAVTREPAFSRKRKTPSHPDRKVTFTTDYIENAREEEKGLRYRAGFCQGDVRTPTEYQLQYTWKTPTFESPLLSAENVLHHSCHPTQIRTERRQEADEPVEEEHRLGVSRYHHESGSEPSSQGIGQDAEPIGEEMEGGRGRSMKDGGGSLGHGRKLTSKSKREPPKTMSVSKSPKGKKTKRGSHHCSRKVHHHHRRQFVSEYRAQFKHWPVAEKKAPDEAPVFGSPQVYTDATDPRLLKHLPLPVGDQSRLPAYQWRSEYNVNFVSPTNFKYVKGAWQESPHSDVPLGNGDQLVDGEAGDGEAPLPANSWLEQVVELRHKAEHYKQRACGTHFSRTHLLRMEQEQRDLFERASSSSVLSFQSSTGSHSRSTPSHEEEEEEEEEEEGGGGMRVEDVESLEEEKEESRGEQQRGEAIPGVTRRLMYSGSHHRKSSSKSQTHVPVRSPHFRGSASVSSDDSGSAQQHETKPPVIRQLHTLGANENASNNQGLQAPLMTSPPATEPQEGRVPTPLLCDSPTGGPLRHHLDLTTPSNGGLLSSPIKLPYPPTSPKFRKDMRSSAPIFPSHVPSATKVEGTKERDHQMGHATVRPLMVSAGLGQQRQCHKGMSSTVPPKAVPKIPVTQNAPKTGAFQRPHSDGGRTRIREKLHQALEDTTHTKLCDTCGAKVHPSSVVNPPLHHTTHARQEQQRGLHMHTMPAPKASHSVPKLKFAHTSHPVWQPDRHSHPQPRHSRSPLLHAPTHTTHAVRGFKQPATMGQLDRDVDELSLSNLSLSSCSVASDILKRAQNRRDNFWTQPQLTAR